MSDSPGSAHPEQHVDRDIENLISEAATLADDLPNEVGTARQPGQTALRTDDTSGGADPSLDTADVETQLDVATGAITQAADELGIATERKDRPMPESKPQKTLTLPPKGASGKSKTTDAAGSDSSAGLSAAATPPPSDATSRSDVQPSAASSCDGHDSGTGDDVGDGTGAKQTDSTAPPRHSLVVGVVNALCVRLSNLLDWLDRPFTRVGPAVRMILGWVAVGLFVAAVALFAATAL